MARRMVSGQCRVEYNAALSCLPRHAVWYTFAITTVRITPTSAHFYRMRQFMKSSHTQQEADLCG
jgi:hypothetical protein